MKQVLAKISILLFSSIVAVLAAFYLYAYKVMLKPVETGKVHDNLTAVKTSIANLFIYSDGETVIAFDSGVDTETTASALKTAGIDPMKVQYLFLTHTDSDHAGGAALFKNAKVYLSDQEEAYLTGTKKRKIFYFEGGNAIDVKYSTFSSGDIFEIGKNKIKAMVLPGHTDGSTVYFINDTILITGDLIRLEGGRAIPMPSYINNDSETAAKSIKELSKYVSNIKILCTSHHGCSTDLKKVFGE